MTQYSANILEDFLNQELLKLNTSKSVTKQDHYSIHKLCFEQVIGQHSIYKDLLSKIKAEYEECIEAIDRGQKEAVYLSGKLAATIMEPETIRNFKQRGDELELKIELIKLHNKGLTSEKPNATCPNSGKSTLTGSKLSWNFPFKSSRSIFSPSFTVGQLTDTVFLNKKLQDLQARVTNLKLKSQARFAPKPLKTQLFKKLLEKEEIKEALFRKRQELKMTIMSLKFSLAVNEEKRRMAKTRLGYSGGVTEAAIAYKETKETMKKADEMFLETVGERRAHQPSQSAIGMTGDDDDPTKDREAEFILQCIGNFFELFEAGEVDEAALIAAHSPKGVLRTTETIDMMKKYDATHKDSSVTVAYWEALIPTVVAGCMKPSIWETLECVKCLLKKGRSDLLFHWIAQDLLSLSEEAGTLILDACHCSGSCSCGLIGIAEAALESVNAHKKVLVCFLRQGRYHTAMNYYKNKTDLALKGNSIFCQEEAEDFLSGVLVGHACRVATIINEPIKENFHSVEEMDKLNS
ncbi:PREDICTED: clathrin heavy chain linker domain-containing protein 1-like isoform X3 [Acropora digitifera]|uniref:clathrin heavy chain linker domain-containing protein 1-like isoform X3 n=1 Tax=Acropora digitifera TaxID=70779 RepID=UPI00077A3308|nr:PREDICTED: clathrin heavy chain linker domain-containing protein 1-like isoform X3 [Acropora digitifera]